MRTLIAIAYLWEIAIFALAATQFGLILNMVGLTYAEQANYFAAAVLTFVGLTLAANLIVRFAPRR